MHSPPNPSAQSQGFDSILQVHEQIHAGLEAHQCHLVGHGLSSDGFRDACQLFQDFADALRAHIEVENEVLIPLFASECPPQRGCTPEILLAEHSKLQRLLGEMETRLRELQKAERVGGEPGAPTAREIVGLIDSQRMLKEVLEHHGIREAASFVPQLELAFAKPRRLNLLAQCDAIHHRAALLNPQKT
jgi:hypothetical protein